MTHSNPRGVSPPKIADLHLLTRFSLDGRVCHRMKLAYGRTMILHRRERIPHCRICRELGIDGKESG